MGRGPDARAVVVAGAIAESRAEADAATRGMSVADCFERAKGNGDAGEKEERLKGAGDFHGFLGLVDSEAGGMGDVPFFFI